MSTLRLILLVGTLRRILVTKPVTDTFDELPATKSVLSQQPWSRLIVCHQSSFWITTPVVYRQRKIRVHPLILRKGTVTLSPRILLYGVDLVAFTKHSVLQEEHWCAVQSLCCTPYHAHSCTPSTDRTARSPLRCPLPCPMSPLCKPVLLRNAAEARPPGQPFTASSGVQEEHSLLWGALSWGALSLRAGRALVPSPRMFSTSVLCCAMLLRGCEAESAGGSQPDQPSAAAATIATIATIATAARPR